MEYLSCNQNILLGIIPYNRNYVKYYTSVAEIKIS